MRFRRSAMAGAWLLCTLSAGALSAAQTLWLDEYDVARTACGWQTARPNQAVGGRKPLAVAGRKFSRGVGTHAPGNITLLLDGQGGRFRALVGLDDEVGPRGTAEFIVKGDGKILYRSGVVRGGQPARAVDVKLPGVKKLELIVTVAGDGYGHDHTDWGEARLDVAGRKPTLVANRGAAVREPPTPLPTSDWTPAREAEDEYTSLTALIPRGKHDTKANGEAFHPAGTFLPGDRDPADVVLRRTRALLDHLRTMRGAPDLSAQARALAALEARRKAVEAGQAEPRKALFLAARSLRRRIALANPLLDFDKILFVKKPFLPPHEGRGNHMCDQYMGFHALPGGGLFVLRDAFSDKPVAHDILADVSCTAGRLKGSPLPPGGFLSPELSFDGRTVLFAYTEGEPTRYRWSERSTYHIFRADLDSTATKATRLTQLTDGPVSDFDPCWLPNGRIAFMSERRGGYGRCHGRPVPTWTLHTMAPDGRDIVCISPHETNEWHPSVDHEGMIVYTRWDYVDRGHGQAHHPWVIRPDGRDARAIQGNFGYKHRGARPNMEMNVRAIPNSRRLIATATAHHGQAYGSLVMVDPDIPDDDAMGPVRRVTPDVRFPESDGSNNECVKYATAWPLSERFYLCVYDMTAETRRGPANNHGIYLADAFGNKVLLYRDPAVGCLDPIPLRPRPRPPVVNETARLAPPPAKEPNGQGSSAVKTNGQPPATGTVSVVNVYQSLKPWPDGTQIKALRIMQVLPKTTPHANGPRIGYGDQKSARLVLGTVPVESDGSAHFRMPVGRPVFFQALDADGLAVQSMRSDTWVHPGQHLSCQGCHDPRHLAPEQPRRVPLALRRAPSAIRPDVEGSHPFSFPRLVQPVLDKHCVACHVKNAGKAPDLRRGDPKRNRHRWYTSYDSLQKYAFYVNNAGWTEPRTTPGRFGARASRLYPMLVKGHHKLKLPPADLHRIALWLDCNSDFFGAYEEIDAQAAGEVIRPSLE